MGSKLVFLKKGIFNFVLVLLSVYTIVHFSIIVLHAGPINPISAKLQPFINVYVKPFFYQNWHLFAPDPITTNFRLYVQVRYTEMGMTKPVESPWIDVMTPLLEKNEKTIFSPHNRMIRLGLGYVHALQLGGFDELTYKVLNKATKKEQLNTHIEESLQQQAEFQADNLYRYVSAFAKAAYPDKKILEIRIMTGRQEAVPYSKRNDDSYKVEEHYTIHEWRKLVEDVLPFP
jgi:hypothetical protein